MITNTIRYIKDFERNSKDNPLHESLLTYLRINPVKDKRDLRYLVEYMHKNHMLEDNASYLYVQFLFNGTVFQKDFRQFVKDSLNGKDMRGREPKSTGRAADKAEPKSKELDIKALKNIRSMTKDERRELRKEEAYRNLEKKYSETRTELIMEKNLRYAENP